MSIDKYVLALDPDSGRPYCLALQALYGGYYQANFIDFNVMLLSPQIKKPILVAHTREGWQEHFQKLKEELGHDDK